MLLVAKNLSDLHGAAWLVEVTDSIIYNLFIAPAEMLWNTLSGHVQQGGFSFLSVIGMILFVFLMGKAISVITQTSVIFLKNVLTRKKRKDARAARMARIRQAGDEFDAMYQQYMKDFDFTQL